MAKEDDPNPSHWTLLAKHGRLTILLLVDPLTPLTTIKSDLLETLRERYPDGIPNPAFKSSNSKSIAIPADAADVALGVLVDINDISKGWEELVPKGNGGGLRDSMKSLGVKDGGFVAFRFSDSDEKADGEFMVEWPSYDESYGEAQSGMEIDSEEKP